MFVARRTIRQIWAGTKWLPVLSVFAVALLFAQEFVPADYEADNPAMTSAATAPDTGTYVDRSESGTDVSAQFCDFSGSCISVGLLAPQASFPGIPPVNASAFEPPFIGTTRAVLPDIKPPIT